MLRRLLDLFAIGGSAGAGPGAPAPA